MFMHEYNIEYSPTPCIILRTIVAGTNARLISLSAQIPEKNAVKNITT